MKTLFLLLLLASLASCSATRQLERAHAVLAAHNLDTPPEQQLSELVKQHPELEGKTVRVVTEHDTVRLPGSVVTVHIPAISTPQSDNSLVDSLMRSAASQLHSKDSAAYAARLRAILAARPKLSRDTLTQVLGNLTVRTWIDRAGLPHTTVTSAPQKIAVEKTVHQTGPVQVQREMTIWERIWLFIKDAAGLIIGIIVVGALAWLFFFVKRQRDKSTTSTL